MIKFNVEHAVKAVQKQALYKLINGSVCFWSDDGIWSILTKDAGRARVMQVLKKYFANYLSQANVNQVWDMLKLELISEKSTKLGVDSSVVIACRNSYILIDEKGCVTATPPNPGYELIHQIKTDYDKNAKCPTFDAFLTRVLPDVEVRNRIQEYVGYTLLGDARYQRALLLIGSGANGKSVFSSIVQLLHHKVQSIKLDNSSRFGMSNLLDADLIVSDELPPKNLDEERLKSLISGDPLFIDIKGATPTTARISGKLMVLGNNYPSIKDSSDGFWRRWDIVPFSVTIPKNERDPSLVSKVEKELGGVLNWALEGLKRLLARGGFDTNLPESMNKALDEARKLADDIGGWHSDRVTTFAGPVVVNKSEIYADYQKWCSTNDFVPRQPPSFWLALRRSRPDLITKKVRITGVQGTMNACSIVLNASSTAANGSSYHLAA